MGCSPRAYIDGGGWSRRWGGGQRRTTGSSIFCAHAVLQRSREVEDWWRTFGLTSWSSRRRQRAPTVDRLSETTCQQLQFLVSAVPAMWATRGTGEMWNRWRRTRRTRRDAHRRWGRTVVAGIRRRTEGHGRQLGLPWTAAFQRSSNGGRRLLRCGSSWRSSRRRRPAPAVALGGNRASVRLRLSTSAVRLAAAQSKVGAKGGGGG
jgi:hypothetical protein